MCVCVCVLPTIHVRMKGVNTARNITSVSNAQLPTISKTCLLYFVLQRSLTLDMTTRALLTLQLPLKRAKVCTYFSHIVL